MKTSDKLSQISFNKRIAYSWVLIILLIILRVVYESR